MKPDQTEVPNKFKFNAGNPDDFALVSGSSEVGVVMMGSEPLGNFHSSSTCSC